MPETPESALAALAALPALALAGRAARRFILRRYRARRDGRVYHPERNPDVARALDRAE